MLAFLCLSCLFATAMAECPDLPTRNNSDVTEMILDGSFNFGIELFKVIADESDRQENVFLSPYSVYNALMLVLFGSAGSTEEQLEEVLRLDSYSKEEFIKALLHDHPINTKHNGSNYIFEVANRVYLHHKLRLNPCLKLGDALKLADFNEKEALAENINKWVKKKTRNKIKNLIQPSQMDICAGFALVNAAYFKGKWQHQFKKEDTKKQWFITSEKTLERTKVDMMFQTGVFNYAFSEELHAYILELPYVGSTVSMYAILPPLNRDGLDNVLRRFSPKNLDKAMKQMTPTTVYVGIPKFNVEKSYELQGPLNTLGVTHMFDPIRANFEDLTGMKGPFVGTAMHKSYIKVDEEGSEAAAATLFVGRSLHSRSSTQFIAAIPFIYLIYDNKADTILFIGIMTDPSK